jgi:hypothetical protein
MISLPNILVFLLIKWAFPSPSLKLGVGAALLPVCILHPAKCPRCARDYATLHPLPAVLAFVSASKTNRLSSSRSLERHIETPDSTALRRVYFLPLVGTKLQSGLTQKKSSQTLSRLIKKSSMEKK